MKTIEQRAEEYATKIVGGHYEGGFKGDMWTTLCARYIEIATDQKAIDDAEYRKDMQYVGVKREELIDKCIDAAIKLMETRIADCVELGIDKQTNRCAVRIRKDFVRTSIKDIINQ